MMESTTTPHQLSVDGRVISQPAIHAHQQAETRRDPITGEWTIFAPERQSRPNEFQSHHVHPSGKVECPFCRGHEHLTRDPLWLGRPGEQEGAYEVCADLQSACIPDWTVRVVPNIFPAVSMMVTTDRRERPRQAQHQALFRSAPVAGGHEVFIESQQHLDSFTQLDLTDATLVLMAYRDRIRYWSEISTIGYVSVFKNVGKDAGASLQHAHSQLIAMNQLPDSVRAICNNVQRYHAETGSCLQCDIVRAELKDKSRIIHHSDDLVAYTPYASRLPRMIRMTSSRHLDRFDELDDTALENIARLMKRCIGWIEQLHPHASYNCLLHTRPPAVRGDANAFHWSIEIFPRITSVAGFEWSSHTMINPVLPELAAAQYRACAAAEDPRYGLC